jgi:hypothetical protein
MTPTKKFSPQNSMSPSVDTAKPSTTGQIVAPVLTVWQAGQNQQDARHNAINRFAGLTWTFTGDWESWKSKIEGRACIKPSEFSDPANPELVNAKPVDGFEILLETSGGHLCEITKRGIPHEFSILDVTFFQRVRQSIGDSLEERFVLGSTKISLEEFAKIAEVEAPHPVAQKAFSEMLAGEKRARIEWEKAVAAVPEPVNQQDRLAAGIASGVAAALVQLGIAKPAAKTV